MTFDDFMNMYNSGTRSYRYSRATDDNDVNVDTFMQKIEDYYKKESEYENAGYLEKLRLDKERAKKAQEDRIKYAKELKEIEHALETESDEKKRETLKAQLDNTKRLYKEAAAEDVDAQKKLKGRNDITETIKSIEKVVETAKKAYATIQKLSKPWADAEHAAAKFTKTVGGTKKAMRQLTDDTLYGVSKGIGVKFNLSSEELIEAQQNYLNGIGRNINIDNTAKESMAAISRISKDTGIDGLGFASQLENFGVNIEKTGDHLGKMFSDASKHGISFSKYADNVHKNIRLAQNYTFRNGIKGLESMAKKATALKLDMQQVANLADKVSTVEGALETSAKLQVLGGPFATMADPLAMLNEGLNDMEGLQDRVIKMVQSMGTFNKQTGEINVSSYNKQRIKAAAEAMNMDYSSLMESVNTQAKREEVKRQMSSSSKADKFDKDMKELILNTATIKDGKAGITIDGKFKTLDEIDPHKDQETLIAMTRSESEDIKQIATDLRSLVQKREGLGKAYDSIQGRITSLLGKAESGILDMFKGGAFGNMLLGAGFVLNNIGIAGDIFKFLGGKGKVSKFASGGIVGGNLTKGDRNLVRVNSGEMILNETQQGTLWKIINGRSNLGPGFMNGGSGAVMGTEMGLKTDRGLTALGLAGIGLPLTVVGTIIGGNTTLHKAGTSENKTILDTHLKDVDTQRKDNYSSEGAKKIEKTLRTNEIFDSLKQKLNPKIDIDLVNTVDKKKKDIEIKKDNIEAKIKENIKVNKKNIENEESLKNRINIDKPNIIIDTATIKGIETQNTNIKKKNFETVGDVVKKDSLFKTHFSNEAKTLIKGKKETGESEVLTNFNKVNHKTNDEKHASYPHSFDININGSLKLIGDKGQSIDIIKELRQTPSLLRDLANMISNEISFIGSGNYYSQNLAIKSPLSSTSMLKG